MAEGIPRSLHDLEPAVRYTSDLPDENLDGILARHESEPGEPWAFGLTVAFHSWAAGQLRQRFMEL